jgi:hypothetical protein
MEVIDSFATKGEFSASKTIWFKWITAYCAVRKMEVSNNWQEDLELEFKRLYPNVTTIKWVE